MLINILTNGFKCRKMLMVSEKQTDFKVMIPVARWEFTTVECYTNVCSSGEDGHAEAVRHIREKCPIHLDIVTICR